MRTLLPTDQKGLLEPLFGIYYHTEWEQRGLTPPDRLPDGIVLPDVDDAAQTLAKTLTRGIHLEPVLAVRLALAQLSRRADLAESRPHHRKAVLHLLDAFTDSGRITPPKRDQYARDFLERRGRHPEEHFFDGFNHELFGNPGHLQFTNDVASLTRFALRNFRLSYSYRHRVTDVTASVEVNRAFTDFKKMLDPQQWEKNVKMTWRRSHFIQAAPTDRSKNGVRVPPKTQTQGFEKFFENAVWTTVATPFADYRNLLDVELDLQGSSEIYFKYREIECLETDFVGLGKRLGGIDVDDGHGRCSDLGQGWCRIEARKRARFSQPEGFLNVVYNGMASVFLTLLIESLVLVGSQVTL